jgi:phytoene dehydrogenase-like protein
MREAAEEAGAVFRTDCAVRQILVRDGKAAGVELESGETLSSRVVVSNADPKRTFLRLLSEAELDPRFRARVEGLRTNAAAGLKLHCALAEAPEYRIEKGLSTEQLREATAIFGTSAEEQRAAWRSAAAGELPEVPIVSGFMPNIFDPSLCPSGKYTWSSYVVWAPVRPKRGTWAERKAEMAEKIFQVMDRYTTNFRKSLIDYVLLTPEDLEETRLLTDGNIHHVDATGDQILWRRPLEELARYRTPVGGLYLCGCGTHPWGEISGAPGHNAAHAILADLGTHSSQP